MFRGYFVPGLGYCLYILEQPKEATQYAFSADLLPLNSRDSSRDTDAVQHLKLLLKAAVKGNTPDVKTLQSVCDEWVDAAERPDQGNATLSSRSKTSETGISET